MKEMMSFKNYILKKTKHFFYTSFAILLHIFDFTLYRKQLSILRNLTAGDRNEEVSDCLIWINVKALYSNQICFNFWNIWVLV